MYARALLTCVSTGVNDEAPLDGISGHRSDSTTAVLNTRPAAALADWIYATLHMMDLVVTLKGNDFTTDSGTDTDDVDADDDIVKINANVGGAHSARFHLKVANQVGINYKLFVTATVSVTVGETAVLPMIVGCDRTNPSSGIEHTNTVASFRIDAGNIVAAHGLGKTLFTADSFPRVVRADTNNALANYSTTMNVAGENGLPTNLHILFRNTASSKAVLEHANCHQCVQARLLMCSDRLTAKSDYPRCTSVAQAVCATSSADGNMCAHGGSTGDPEWVRL